MTANSKGKKGNHPPLLLGSSERDSILRDARRIEKNAEVLYEKSAALRKEADLLMEQVYEKRALCAPIRSLPLETLTRILLLATPDSFAFYLDKEVDNPLSAVSRAWRGIIDTTPEFYSRINIIPKVQSFISDLIVREAEKRLPSWLAKARSTGLNISFHWTVSPQSPHRSYFATVHSIWTTLLSLVGNWQELSCHGSAALMHEFWERANSAQRLEIMSLHLTDVGVPKPPLCSQIPSLQHVLLSGKFPGDFITNQLYRAVNLQTLTLQNITSFPKDDLRGIAASFPLLTKLRLEDVIPSPSEEASEAEPSDTQLAIFERLQHFELSRLREYGTVVLPALHGCSMLKSIRLQFTAIHILEKYDQLPSVEWLELELGLVGSFGDDYRNNHNLRKLFAILPSLKYLKVSPQPGDLPRNGCDARGILDMLLLHKDSIQLPTCPDLAGLVFERAWVPRYDTACLLAERTFNASPNALKFIYNSSPSWYKEDLHREARFTNWNPRCLVTTLGCPAVPDMVDAGLQDLIDQSERGKLRLLFDPDDEILECEPDCQCGCGYGDCQCCEHFGDQW